MLEMTNLMEFSKGSIVMNPTKGGSSDDLVRPYLGQLSCQAVHGLYLRYLPDFVLFKYQMANMIGWGVGGRGCGHSV